MEPRLALIVLGAVDPAQEALDVQFLLRGGRQAPEPRRQHGLPFWRQRAEPSDNALSDIGRELISVRREHADRAARQGCVLLIEAIQGQRPELFARRRLGSLEDRQCKNRAIGALTPPLCSTARARHEPRHEVLG